MTAIPEIVVYQAIDPVPDRFRFVARLYELAEINGQRFHRPVPKTFNGATAAEAAEQAVASHHFKTGYRETPTRGVSEKDGAA